MPDEAVHEAISVLEDGGAVALSLTRPAAHYFGPDGPAVELRLLDGFTELGRDAATALRQALARGPLFSDLRDAHDTLARVAARSFDHETLLTRRYVLLFQSHPLLDAALILDHAGAQSRSPAGPRVPTIFLPLDLLNLVRDGRGAHDDDFQRLLEHADFHLRGDTPGVVINGHPYTSIEEHTRIQRLWAAHRERLAGCVAVDAAPVELTQAAYRAMLLYLLGAIDLVLADTVPMVLQRLESTDDDLVSYIPELFETLRRALLAGPGAYEGSVFKMFLVGQTGGSVRALLDAHDVSLPEEAWPALDRPAARLLSIRRTMSAADLDELEATVRTEGRRFTLAHATAWLDRHPGGDDLRNAVAALTELPATVATLERLCDGFVLSPHEGRILALLAHRCGSQAGV